MFRRRGQRGLMVFCKDSFSFQGYMVPICFFLCVVTLDLFYFFLVFFFFLQGIVSPVGQPAPRGIPCFFEGWEHMNSQVTWERGTDCPAWERVVAAAWQLRLR